MEPAAENRKACRASSRSARYWCMWEGPLGVSSFGQGGSVDSERVRYPGGQYLDDAGGVEDHRDGDGQHQELDKTGDLASEQEEDRDDPHDAQEQGPEQPLQVGDQAVSAQSQRSR